MKKHFDLQYANNIINLYTRMYTYHTKVAHTIIIMSSKISKPTHHTNTQAYSFISKNLSYGNKQYKIYAQSHSL